MINYLIKYHKKLFLLFYQHIELVFIVIMVSIILAILISLLAQRFRLISIIVLSLFGAIYSIPSLALFALLIPFLGIGKQTAIFVLILYNQYILIRNILTAFQSIDKSIIEAGLGMGLDSIQLFWKIQLPLSIPTIIGGIRIATISTIGIGTIASLVNAGGLGVILFEGIRVYYLPKIFLGGFLASVLAFISNYLLLFLEKKMTLKATGNI